MKRTMKKMVSMALTGTMAVAVLAGAGTSEVKAADKAKIGVLVADVSGEEAQGFRSYYENYIAGNYDVEFNYTDALQSAEDEKTAIEKFASQGCQAIISFSSSGSANFSVIKQSSSPKPPMRATPVRPSLLPSTNATV